jgi:hypothetical protein
MAGVNPATGQFDPYYNSGAGIPAGDVQSKTNKAGVTTFTNPTWKVSGPISSSEQPVATGGSDTAATSGEDPNVTAARIAAASQAASDQAQADLQKQQQEYERQARQNEAMQAVKAAFSQYGLESLYGIIEDYARKDYNAATISIMLRETEAYKKRFPAQAELAKRGRALSEAEYIDYERTAASLEQQYGLPKGMLQSSVTALLTNEVSALEMGDRVQLAAANSLTAPQDLKDTMMRYYNLDASNLTAYYLDPSVSLPYLEKRSAAAALGTEAYRQNIDIGVTMAEDLEGMGIQREQARQGFAQVAGATGLTAGKGETVTQGQLIKGTFGQEDNAQKTLRVAKTRASRFAGGGGFTDSAQGVTGLGSSST